MHKRNIIEELVKEVLDGTELDLRTDGYHLEEDLETCTVRFNAQVHHAVTGEKKVIRGEGVGLVDACFRGFMDMYSTEYPSLKSVLLSDYHIQADIETTQEGARSGAEVLATLRLANSFGHEFLFEDRSPSLTRSTIQVVVRGLSFFINTERAFVAVYRARQHAEKMGRHDSKVRYTSQLSTLVDATSYSDVIAQLQEESRSAKTTKK